MRFSPASDPILSGPAPGCGPSERRYARADPSSCVLSLSLLPTIVFSVTGKVASTLFFPWMVSSQTGPLGVPTGQHQGNSHVVLNSCRAPSTQRAPTQVTRPSWTRRWSLMFCSTFVCAHACADTHLWSQGLGVGFSIQGHGHLLSFQAVCQRCINSPLFHQQ